jgi:hypothetical protein
MTSLLLLIGLRQIEFEVDGRMVMRWIIDASLPTQHYRQIPCRGKITKP